MAEYGSVRMGVKIEILYCHPKFENTHAQFQVDLDLTEKVFQDLSKFQAISEEKWVKDYEFLKSSYLHFICLLAEIYSISPGYFLNT